LLTTEERQRAYRAMALARALDEKMWRLARAGRAHFAVPCAGHEAISAGYALQLEPGRDYVAPHYRDLAAMLVLGMEPRDVMLHFFAKRSDPNAGGRQPYAHWGSRRLGILSQQGPQPNQVTHGVGSAWASKYTRDGGVTIVAYGDGGAQKGEVHEAMNFAAVHALPCVFIVHRNGYTQSVRSTLEYHEQVLSKRALGYGIPGITIDGANVEVVAATARTAIDRARRGDGPTLIDAVCKRFMPNTSNDDDSIYRSAEERARVRDRDPLGLLRALVDADFADAVDAQSLQTAEDAATWAEEQAA
jgi:2-oxoisovalerate dehydrogenase E1 component alpha subunit